MFTRQQQGKSLAGMLTTLCVIIFFLYATLVVGPMYYTNYQVGGAMDYMVSHVDFNASESNGQVSNKVRNIIAKNFRIQNIDLALLQNITIKRIDRDKAEVEIKYTIEKHFVYNLDVAANFQQKRVLTSK